MAEILTNQSSDTTGSGTAINAEGGWIEIKNNAVFDGAIITIEASSADIAGEYSPLDRITTITSPGWRKLDLPSGTYVRAKQSNSGSSTSITVHLFPTA